jgi:ribosomal protein S18 acetylase RimI-like enzyme
VLRPSSQNNYASIIIIDASQAATLRMYMEFQVRRLEDSDYESYVNLRVDGFRKQKREFRFSPEDELSISRENTVKRIKNEFIVGVFNGADLIGIGGCTPCSGSKLNHRALLWGMYVSTDYRGMGLSNKIVESLLSEATRIGMETILLTVVNENDIAIGLYKKWGFSPYAVDRLSVKIGENDYLDELLMVKQLT